MLMPFTFLDSFGVQNSLFKDSENLSLTGIHCHLCMHLLYIFFKLVFSVAHLVILVLHNHRVNIGVEKK